MNNKRRTMLQSVLDELDRLRGSIDKEEALKIMRDSQEQLQMLADEEQDALDNRPESFMWSSMSDDMNENVSDLYEAYDELSVMLESCNEMKTYSYDPISRNLINVVTTVKQTIIR